MKKTGIKYLISRLVIVLLMAVCFNVVTLPACASTKGWVKKDNKMYYYKNNKPLTGYHTIDDEGYYFDKTGVRQTGQRTIQGKTYYFNPKNGKLTFGWVTVNKTKYYYSINGTVGKIKKVKKVKGRYYRGSIYGSGLSKKELKTLKKKVITFMNKKIATNMTPIEKILAANNYICQKARYKSCSKSGTAYGALVRKKAVCTGYSRAFVALCDAMGIKSKLISSTNITHTWNLVKIKSRWYHIDVQTNDSYGENIIFLEKDSYLKSANIRWSKKMPKCSKRYKYTISLPKEGSL